jgi:DNA replication protein DnaC
MRKIRERQRDPEEDPRRWNRLLDEANIPSRYRRARLDLVRGEPKWLSGAVEDPNAWLGRGYGYHINGPNNTGKSSAAAILAMDAIKRCERVTWLPVRDVPGVRFREGPRETILHERLYKTDLLVLDDLGSEGYRLSGAGGGALEAVIRILYDRDRSVVYTSNAGWAQFQGAYAGVPSLVSVVMRQTWPVSMTELWPEGPE